MYKYSKLVKENFFKDKYLAFYWLVFRKEVSAEILINDQTPDGDQEAKKVAKVKAKEITANDKFELTVILEEFDTLAKETVQNEEPQLQIFIDNGITPGEETGTI